MKRKILAEIITIGDEILYGQTLDTNAHWISGELSQLGIKTRRRTTIGDQREEIIGALNVAEKFSDLVLITGGLGPTKDDLTKNVLAEFFESEMAINETALADVKAFFDSKGRTLSDLNRKQAELPVVCQLIRNHHGTAPGMWFERSGTVFISMPGVPHEMRNMVSNEVIPRVRSKFDLPVIIHRMVNTVGIGESWLSELIADWEDRLPSHLKLAYLPDPGIVKLRITASGDDPEILEKEIDSQVDFLQKTAGKYIFGFGKISLEEAVGKLLSESGETISTAESCSGGYLAHKFTSVPGSSKYFIGSVVAYDNMVKIRQLGVPPEVLEKYGAVSEETVRIMAENVRKVFNTGYGLAISGIAGPDGGTPDKPVGTVWQALSDGSSTIARKMNLGNDRLLNIHLSAVYSLNLLRQSLLKITGE